MDARKLLASSGNEVYQGGDRVYKKRPNKNVDIRFKLKIYSLKDKFKEHRNKYVEHMTRMNVNRLLTQIYYYKLSGKGSLGRQMKRSEINCA